MLISLICFISIAEWSEHNGKQKKHSRRNELYLDGDAEFLYTLLCHVSI